ncbi:MAG TPA: helix-turn-helix transcriptional regulator [Acidobacteriota bacterium]|nr:helix-turn-helix transcriptional regulator [Acidobacteriota bacterium]
MNTTPRYKAMLGKMVQESSQLAVARKLGISQPYVSVLLSDSRDPSTVTLRRIAQFLGLELHEALEPVEVSVPCGDSREGGEVARV